MKNLKPFDLQEALAGKAVKLCDGRKAYVRHHETELSVGESYKLLGYAADGEQLSWSEDGDYFGAGNAGDMDIIGMYPETRVINGFEVPAPEINELECDTDFYLASPITEQLYMGIIWVGNRTDKFMLNRGLVFLNKEDAIATAKAMLGIDPHSEDEL